MFADSLRLSSFLDASSLLADTKLPPRSSGRSRVSLPMVPAEMYLPHPGQQTLLLSDTTTTQNHVPLPLPPRLFFLPNLTTMVPSTVPLKLIDDHLRLLVLQRERLWSTRRTATRMKLNDPGGVAVGNEEEVGPMRHPFLLLLETEEIKETNLLRGLALLDLSRVLVQIQALVVVLLWVLLVARPPQLRLLEARVQPGRFLVLRRRRRRKLLLIEVETAGYLLHRLRTVRRALMEGDMEGAVDPSARRRATEAGANES